METTFPAKLEFTFLEIGGRLNEDINCAISLTKGLQNFGQIKFKIKSQDTIYSFHEQKIINFSYTIRLTTRKDFFFHINLFDSHLNQQIGDFIGISCHMLAETFQNDSTTVIQKSDQFLQGVILKYKIYQPQVQIKESNTISFKNLEQNDFISNIFAGPNVQSNNLLGSQLKLSRADKPGHLNKKSSSNLKNSQGHMKKERNQQRWGQSQLQKSKKQELKKSVGKKQPSNEFFSFVFKKQSGFVEKKKKYQFYQKQNHHTHGLSKKLKAVIILLILGAVFLLVDSIADKFGSEQKKKHKKKSAKKEKIEHF